MIFKYQNKYTCLSAAVFLGQNEPKRWYIFSAQQSMFSPQKIKGEEEEEPQEQQQLLEFARVWRLLCWCVPSDAGGEGRCQSHFHIFKVFDFLFTFSCYTLFYMRIRTVRKYFWLDSVQIFFRIIYNNMHLYLQEKKN